MKHLLIIALFCSACVPLPYATPPLRVTVGAAAPIAAADQDGDGTTTPVGGSMLMLRGGIDPMQLFVERPLDRSLDFGAGYLLESPSRGRRRHGPYLGGGVCVWEVPGDKSRLRLFTFGMIDLLFQRSAAKEKVEAGGGFTAGVELSLVGWTESGFEIDEATDTSPDDPNTGYVDPEYDQKEDSSGRTTVIGIAYGEYAIGGYASAGYRRLPQESYWIISGGLVVRLPSSFGAILIWLL